MYVKAVKTALRLHLAHPYSEHYRTHYTPAAALNATTTPTTITPTSSKVAPHPEFGTAHVHSAVSLGGKGRGLGVGEVGGERGGEEEGGGLEVGGGEEGGQATGDFLIFMPGQDEVESTCFWLEMQVCHVALSSKVVK